MFLVMEISTNFLFGGERGLTVRWCRVSGCMCRLKIWREFPLLLFCVLQLWGERMGSVGGGRESCFNCISCDLIGHLFLESDWLVSTYNSCTGDGEVWLLLFARLSRRVCTCEDGVGGVEGGGEGAGL